jgi:hypothetical protein
MVVFSVVGGVGLVAVQLLLAPALPNPHDLIGVLFASMPVIGEWVVPLGAMAGITALLARWRREGEWVALQAAGISGGHLIPAALTLGIAVGIGTAFLTHQGAPWGRATFFDVLVHQIVPLPGRATSVGGLTVLPGSASEGGLQDLLLVWEHPEGLVVASAAQGQLGGDGGTLELLQGEVIGPQARLTFERLAVPLPQVSRMAPPSAWTDRALAESSDAYHHAIGFKRTVWPLASVLFVLVSVPWTLAGRAWAMPIVVLSWWTAVRICDGLAPIVGGLGSAVLPLILLTLATGWSWLRWASR